MDTPDTSVSPSPASEEVKPSKKAADPEARERAAEKARVRRRVAKLKAAKNEEELRAAARELSGEPMPEPPHPEPEEERASSGPGASDGWPSEEKIAGCMGAANGLWSQLRGALTGTRYGTALEAREIEVPAQVDNGDGTQSVVMKKVLHDPVAAQLAPPTAAWMASGGGSMTPGQAIGLALLFTLGPTAAAHAVELGIALAVKLRERSESKRARVVEVPKRESEAAPPGPVVPAQPETPKPASAVVRFDSKREAAAS